MTSIPEWSQLLRTLASSALAGTPVLDATTSPAEKLEFITTFRDNMGQRRAVDRPLLHWLLGVPLSLLSDDASPDVRAWEKLAGLTREFLRSSPGGTAHDLLIDAEDEVLPHAPLVGDPRAIEIATETELGVLHATWNLATVERSWIQLRPAVAAARWMIANVQPDNATGHPWAVHAFLTLADDGDQEAAMYAETLIHNTLVAGNGKPDRFSALLLLDAAHMLA